MPRFMPGSSSTAAGATLAGVIVCRLATCGRRVEATQGLAGAGGPRLLALGLVVVEARLEEAVERRQQVLVLLPEELLRARLEQLRADAFEFKQASVGARARDGTRKAIHTRARIMTP